MFICAYYELLSPFFAVCLPFKTSVHWGPAGIDVHTVVVLRAEGKSDAWPSGGRKLTYGRTQYLNVVFVLSKLVINA